MPAVALQNGVTSSSSKGPKRGKPKEKKVHAGGEGEVRAGPSTLPPPLPAKKPNKRKKAPVEENAVPSGNATPARVQKKGEKKDGTSKRKAPVVEEEKAVADDNETPARVKKKGEKEGVSKRMMPAVASSSSSSRASRVAGEGETVGTDLSSTCRFPMSRVKRIVAASDGERRGGGSGAIRATHEAVFLANKAAELFLELFARDAYACAKKDHKKFLSYKHLSFSVSNKKRYEFLSDFVPEKVSAEEALKAKALAEY